MFGQTTLKELFRIKTIAFLYPTLMKYLSFTFLILLVNTISAQVISKTSSIESVIRYLKQSEISPESHSIVMDSIMYQTQIPDSFKIELVDRLAEMANDSTSAVLTCQYSNYLGQYFRYKGNYTYALKYYKKSHNLYIKHQIQNKREYLNLGHLYNNVGDDTSANTYYQKALRFARDTIPNGNSSKNNMMAWVILTMATKSMHSSPDTSLLKIREAIRLWKLAPNNREQGAISYAYKSIADYHIKHTKDFHTALKIADTIQYWDNHDSTNGLNFALTKGLCHYHLGQSDSALFWFLKADSICGVPQKNGFQRLDAMSYCKYLLTMVYQSRGNYKAAFYYQKAHNTLSNIINSKRNQGVVSYEREKNHVAAIEADKNLEIEAERLQKRYLTLVGILLAILALALVVLLIQSRKKNFAVENARKMAEKSEAFKRQFLANMSHEIRGPMNATLGLSRLLLATDLNQKQSKYLNTILASSENLLSIVNQVLDLSKMEAGKMEIVLEPVKFHSQMNLLQQTFDFQARDKGIVFSIEVGPNVPEYIITDSGRLHQLLVNLCSNAINFTDEGSVKVIVSKMAEKEELKILIQDTGVGISDTVHALLFDEFVQVGDMSNRVYEGTGLGLSISKSIVSMVGGTIELKSQESVGSEFSVIWPYQLTTELEYNQKVDRKRLNAEPLTGIRILLAENNPFNVMVIEDTLKYLIPKCDITHCVNGLEVLEKLELNNSEFDIILMDINMPSMNGLETTRKIRNHNLDQIRNMPIVALTSNVLKEDRAEILKSGMNGYITKPFSHEELISKLLEIYKV